MTFGYLIAVKVSQNLATTKIIFNRILNSQTNFSEIVHFEY